MNSKFYILTAEILLATVVTDFAADPLETWTWINPVPNASQASALTYGDGRFVAAVGLGAMMISADGVTWNMRDSGTHRVIRKLIYDAGRFVAVGDAILTSIDGTNWVQALPYGRFRGVSFGNGRFVAVGQYVMLSSTDAVNWVQSNFEVIPNIPYDIAYGNGQFIAVGYADGAGATWVSTDGATWAQRSAGSHSLRGIIYGNEEFVAVGEAGTILTSRDGVNWDQPQSGTTNDLQAISYGNGRFVVLGDGILSSADGVTWNQTHTGAGGTLGFGNNEFLVATGSAILSSTDGINWVERQMGNGDPSLGGLDLTGIAYGNGKFVLAGFPDNVYTTTILTSADLVRWVRRGPAAAGRLNGVLFADGRFVAWGSEIITSTDGDNWSERQTGTAIRSLAYGNGQFVAVGPRQYDGAGGYILTSSDGVKWTPQRSGIEGDINGIAFGNGQFVAVASAFRVPQTTSMIIVSTDGANWNQRYSETINNLPGLSDVAYGRGQFVAVGGLGTILTSTDGVVWRKQQSSGRDLSNISYDNGQFFAISGGDLIDPGPGTLISSKDGINWVGWEANFQPWVWWGIRFVSGRFMAVGSLGSILQSGPIINLTLTPDASAGQLSLSLEGPTGLNYTIQSSADLISWSNVTRITGSPGKIVLEGLRGEGTRNLFYRAQSP